VKREDFFNIQEVEPPEFATKVSNGETVVTKPARYRLVVHVFSDDVEELKRIAEALGSAK
jgi:hypothetical protein